MAGQSTTEIELNEPDESASRPRQKAKRPVRDADEGDDVDGDEGDDASLGLTPAEVHEMIMTLLSVPPEIAGAAYGLKRNASYKACKSGEIKSFKIGHKIICPTAPLRKKLCLESPLSGDTLAPQIAQQPKKQEVIKSPKRRRR